MAIDLIVQHVKTKLAERTRKIQLYSKRKVTGLRSSTTSSGTRLRRSIKSHRAVQRLRLRRKPLHSDAAAATPDRSVLLRHPARNVQTEEVAREAPQEMTSEHFVFEGFEAALE